MEVADSGATEDILAEKEKRVETHKGEKVDKAEPTERIEKTERAEKPERTERIERASEKVERQERRVLPGNVEVFEVEEDVESLIIPKKEKIAT